MFFSGLQHAMLSFGDRDWTLCQQSIESNLKAGCDRSFACKIVAIVYEAKLCMYGYIICTYHSQKVLSNEMLFMKNVIICVYKSIIRINHSQIGPSNAGNVESI